MADLAAIRDYVREQALIETDDWSSTKLDIVINEGYNEVSQRFNWPWLESSNLFSVTADQQGYDLSAIAAGSEEIARIQAIVDVDSRNRLVEIGSNEAFQRFGGDFSSSSRASEFYIWADQVNLLPIPDTTEADAYKIYYYKKPTVLANDAAEPEWDEQFHYVLAQWCLARVWEREEDYEKGVAWQAKFDAQVERMARYYLDRAVNVPQVVGLRGAPRRSGRVNNTPFLDG